MATGYGRTFTLIRKQTLTRPFQIFQKVLGVPQPLPLDGYTGKYVASENLEDTAEQAKLKLDITLTNPDNGEFSIIFPDEEGTAGTDQEPFDGFEEITLITPAGDRIPLVLESWGGNPYGKFRLLNTRVA